VPDKEGGGAFTHALVAAVAAAKKQNPNAHISNRALMSAIDKTLSEGNFKMTPALVCSQHNAEEPFFCA
jgi:hypothetical protein